MNNLIVFLIFVRFILHNCFQIFGDFKECIVGSNLNMLKLDEQCFRNTQSNDKIFKTDISSNMNKETFSSFVFSKHNFILETKGYECKMLIHKYRYSKDFLFNKYVQNEVEHIRLSRMDCMLMVKEKQCGKVNNKKKMSCTSKECFFAENIIDEYPFYFGTIVKEFYECEYNEKIVMAQSLIDSVFHNSIEPCYAEDEVCYFSDSTVIWEREDIRKCPFERLLELNDLKVKENSDDKIFLSATEQYLFKLIKKENHCGFDFYLTTEGLYLGFYDLNESLRTQFLNIPISKYEISHFMDKDKNDLVVSENDYSKFKLNEMILDVTCSFFINFIRMNLNQQDKFLNINYLGKENIIIYINNGQAFLPICTNVSSVYLVEILFKNGCEKDFRIGYATKNESTKFKQGFLRENNIITQFSTKLNDCKLDISKTLIVVPDKGSRPLILKRTKTNFTIDNLETQMTEFKFSAGNLKDVYNHHEYLVNGSDIYEKIHEITEPSRTFSFYDVGSKNSFYDKNDNLNTKREPFKGLTEVFSNIFNGEYFKNVKIIFVLFISGILLLVLYIFFRNIEFVFKKYKFQTIQNMEATELEIV